MGKHGTGYIYKKRGKGNYRVRWMLDGKLHDESTGTDDIEKARKIAGQKTACASALGDVRALTARLEKAKDEQAVLEAKTNPSLTLFRMVEAFKSCDVVRRKKNSEATFGAWVTHGNLLIDEFGGNTELRQLTREQVERFMREYEGKVSAFQFNATLYFYKRVWEVLKIHDSPTELKARLPDKSPWEYIMPMKCGEVYGRRPFTEDQLTRIWRVLDEKNDPELKLLFDLAKNTGARLHDLVSWTWNNIRFNSNVTDGVVRNEAFIEWKPIKTKNSTGKLMILPILDDRVVNDLFVRFKKRNNDDELVLPEMFRRYNSCKASSLTYHCQQVFKKAGLSTNRKIEGYARANCVYGMHSFRHTLVSELFQKGVDLGTIQHLYSGHGSAFVTELYAHADIDKKRADLSNLSRIETTAKKPDGFQTFLGMMNEDDKKEYDRIKLMDVPKAVSSEMVALLKFKNVSELQMLKKWIDDRISAIG